MSLTISQHVLEQESTSNQVGASAQILISCIIPCLNERHELPMLLRLLRSAAEEIDLGLEIIVVDGGSKDGTLSVAKDFPEVRWLVAPPLRAKQLNAGARVARGSVLYFAHADTRPPLSCFTDISIATAEGHLLGGYPFCFDSNASLLRLNSWATSFNVTATRGGDQSIFIDTRLFWSLGGFSEAMTVMEEYELLRAAKALGVPYHLMRTGRTLVSARKYEGRSWLRVQIANVYAMTMWRGGADVELIRRGYAAILQWPRRRDGGRDAVVERTYIKTRKA